MPSESCGRTATLLSAATKSKRATASRMSTRLATSEGRIYFHHGISSCGCHFVSDAPILFKHCFAAGLAAMTSFDSQLISKLPQLTLGDPEMHSKLLTV